MTVTPGQGAVCRNQAVVFPGVIRFDLYVGLSVTCCTRHCQLMTWAA